MKNRKRGSRKALRGGRRNRRNKQQGREGKVKIQYRHGQEYLTVETARVHHFVQRKHGGSKRYDIQGILCGTCHTSV